jgi:hypothetical protein
MDWTHSKHCNDNIRRRRRAEINWETEVGQHESIQLTLCFEVTTIFSKKFNYFL